MVFMTIGLVLLTTTPARSSSHMDAPLIVLDPAANTTDVYAFRSSSNNQEYLTVALAVYPFEEPGIGPNKYNFDDNVLYQIHVATGADVAAGRATVSYGFQFKTSYKNTNTIAQSYLGPVDNVDDANQNLTQRYSVTKTVGNGRSATLFSNVLVPPNNQGLVTRFYNQNDNGENRAKEGVALESSLDRYTVQTVTSNTTGYRVFAGQRDDGFYADIQSIFDLDFSFSGPNKPFDSQGGFNVHTIVLNIPIAELGGAQQVVGVYATTSRERVQVLANTKKTKKTDAKNAGNFVQVGRQGNPLFNEALVAIKDKDLYSQTDPSSDATNFNNYALNPELAAILGLDANHRTNRTDLAGIFIPDLIKTDLSTGAVHLAGGQNPGATPDDAGFHRLSIFGGDALHSTAQIGFFNNGTVPGGWPNGRRFGDDVLDIAVLALLSDLRDPANPVLPPNSAAADVDKVTSNDIGYNKVFPYAATPLNGRAHGHH
ncbi:MAG: hypothetical protein JWO45_954 [Spartobacteria bacterium]|nr:hypothetical protein [Spartobacteria bacterium]